MIKGDPFWTSLTKRWCTQVRSPAPNQAMSISERGPFTSSVSSLINRKLYYKMAIKLFKFPHLSAHLFQTNTITFTRDLNREILKKKKKIPQQHSNFSKAVPELSKSDVD